MRSLNKIQVSLILGGVALLALLYFAPKTNPGKEAKKETQPTGAVETLVAELTKGLNPEVASQANELESKMKETGDHAYSDSLYAFWNFHRQPVLAAYHEEKHAEATNHLHAWNKAGESWLNAGRIAPETQKPILFDKARNSFEKALAISPQDIEAKTNLGICYVEATPDPMKGIMLLREVLQADSNNIKAHLNLGYFSVKSGQYDKALERFTKVLTLQPDNYEVYLYLGDVYETKGDFKNAIINYEKYAFLSNSPEIAEDVSKYIEKLKSKQTS